MAKRKTVRDKRAAAASSKSAGPRDLKPPMAQDGKKAKSSSAASRKTTSKELAKKTTLTPRSHLNLARANWSLSKHREQLRDLDDRVTGTSFGNRIKNGRLTKEMVITLHVATQEDKDWLKNNASSLGYLKLYDGIDTDIVVSDFHTSASSAPLPDGECISGPGGNGTLGTTVIVDIDGVPQSVWLTAAHVVSSSIAFPGGKLKVSLCNGGHEIGFVSKDDYFRDADLDVAIVVPDPPLPAPTPTLRNISPLSTVHQNKIVTMKGARTPRTVKGKIISLDFDGRVTSPGGRERVTDHFLVRSETGLFAEKGDSGAVVFLGSQLLGVLRAVDVARRLAVVTRMDFVQQRAKEFIL